MQSSHGGSRADFIWQFRSQCQDLVAVVIAVAVRSEFQGGAVRRKGRREGVDSHSSC